MKKTLPYIFCILLWVLSTPLLLGCDNDATETGNPAIPEETGNSTPEDTEQITDGAMLSNPASILVDLICSKLTECHDDLSEMECIDEILESETIGTAFGIEEGMFDYYQEVIDSLDMDDNENEWESVLDVDWEAHSLCLEAIYDLSCEDPAVQAVDVETFENIEDMIPDEHCPEVLSVPEGVEE